MKELYKAIISTSTDRLKNPFIGSFILSWLVFNWRPIVFFILSDCTIEKRIELIDDKYSASVFYLWYPLFFSIFYLVLLPYLMWLFELISTKAIVARKFNQTKQEVLNLEAAQEIAIEESKLEEIKANYKEKADLNNQIKNLIVEIDFKNEMLESLKNKNLELSEKMNQMSAYIKSSNTENYTDEEKQELENDYKKFKNSDLFDFFKEIGTSISSSNLLPRSMDKLLLEKYKYSGIIEERIDKTNKQAYYVLSRKGKYFWKEYVLNIRFEKKKESEEEDLPF